MKSIINTLLLLLILLFLSACSNTPADGDIEKQVRASFQSDGQDTLYEVTSVNKVNGRKTSEGEYLAEVEYTLKFKIGLQQLAVQMQKEIKGFGDVFEMQMALDMLKVQYGVFKAGDVRTNKQEVLFVKSEQGWQIFTL
jgi:hypothetical protein